MRSQREERRLGGQSNPQMIMDVCEKVEVNTSYMCTLQGQGTVVTCCNKINFFIGHKEKKL